jgi:hypothetical protein
MTREAGNPRAAESGWGCEQVGLTLFHKPGSVLASEGPWATLTGQPPDASVGKPKTQERVEIGGWAGGQLVLRGQPQAGRTDWLLAPTVESDPAWPPFRA